MADLEFDAVKNSSWSVQADAPKLLVRLCGLFISVFLILGFLYLSYELIRREISDLPIISAIKGPSKIRSEKPGGILSIHTGLTVNGLQESGKKEEPVSRIVLAPDSVGVNNKDMFDIEKVGDAGGQVDLGSEIENALASIFEKTANLVDDIPSFLKDAGISETQSTSVETFPTPVRRPIHDNLGVGLPVVESRVENALSPFRVGEPLVYLGSFRSLLVAKDEMSKFKMRFADYLTDKQVFLQSAEMEGEPIYRMRVAGFPNLSNTRRFCSVIVSSGDTCISDIYKKSKK
jgi:hypothetical protein